MEPIKLPRMNPFEMILNHLTRVCVIKRNEQTIFATANYSWIGAREFGMNRKINLELI
jgi:hypothetical protein